MQFTVLQERIKAAIATVMPAVAGKTTLPVLTHILFRWDAEGLTLAATNLELGIVVKIDARSDGAGSLCLPAKLLSDVISALPNERVVFDVDVSKASVTLKCVRSSATIKGIEGDEFPTIPSAGNNPHVITLPAALVRQVASGVAFAASDTTDRPVLTGVWTRVAGNKAVFAAADGYRMVRLGVGLEADGATWEALIPAQTYKALAGALPKSCEHVRAALASNGGSVVFTADDVTIITRLIDGNYPDIDRVIPTVHTTRAVLTRTRLAQALRLATMFAADSSFITNLDVRPGSNDIAGEVQVAGSSAEIGAGDGIVDGMIDGNPLVIRLNAQYFAAALSAAGSDQVAIEFQSPGHPAVIRPVGGDADYVQIVMPMAVRN